MAGPAGRAAPGASRPASSAIGGAAQRALEIYNRAQDALRRGDRAQYGAEQKRLEEALRSLSTQ